jgi:hypothetical protein
MGVQKDKLSEIQKQEIERLRNFVSRNRLNAHMTGTKWRAAIDAVQALPGYRPSFRVKCITDAQDPEPGPWDEGFPGNIPLYNSIEWLELNPFALPTPGAPAKGKRENFGEALKRRLAAAQIPMADSMTGIRILGYSRPERK